MNMLSVSQAAEVAGLSATRIRAFCRTGRLGQKVGRSYVIPETELRAFLALPRPPGRPSGGPKPRKKRPRSP